MYLWIALGGLAGTFARLGVQNLMLRSWATGFPWGTLLVNLSGSFLIGFIARSGAGHAGLSPDLRAGLLVGFCGAYTTFSTYSFETVQLLHGGAYLRAGLYAVGSVILALAGTVLGMAAAGGTGPG